jgi:hypothetical protein
VRRKQEKQNVSKQSETKAREAKQKQEKRNESKKSETKARKLKRKQEKLSKVGERENWLSIERPLCYCVA